jgi:pimeloyl-ACP methyl ester carboxylesterase
MQRNRPSINATYAAILILSVIGLTGCKAWDIDSARKFAYVASFSTPTTVDVKRNKRNAIKDRARSLIGLVPKPDPRTIEFLKRHGLEKDWKKDPAQTIASLSQLTRQELGLEPVFALSNLKFVYAETLRMQGDHQSALSEYADTTVLAYRFLFDPSFDQYRNAYDPIFRGICDLYNQSLEEMLRIIDDEKTLMPNNLYSIKTETGTIQLTIQPQGRWKNEDISKLQFVSDFQTEGLTNQYRTFGLGVPLIAGWKADRSKSPATEYYPPGLTIPLTAFLRVESSHAATEDTQGDLKCTLFLFDPLVDTEIQIADRSIPLESDVSTPLATFLSDPLLNTYFLGIISMLNGEFANEFRGLYMLEPYDPEKIPVVLVHGLGSSPITWTEMFNDLRANPQIQKNYQFWFYMYPSGQPFWTSAREMRADVSRARHRLDPAHEAAALDKMVFVGHSMGGLVARMQTIHSDDLFWKLVSDKPPADLKGDEELKTELVQTLNFEPNLSVRRVITIGSPHLGSNFANGTTIWLSRSFFNLPDMLRQSEKIVKQNPNYFRDTDLITTSTSVDSLSPENPVFKAIQQARVAPWVKYHNIYGNVNKKNVLSFLGTKIVGPGDGVVPIESARAIDAVSKLEVDQSHTTIHMNKKAILEVKRILVENLIEVGRIQKPDNLPTLVNSSIDCQPIRGSNLVPFGIGNMLNQSGHGSWLGNSEKPKNQSWPSEKSGPSVTNADGQTNKPYSPGSFGSKMDNTTISPVRTGRLQPAEQSELRNKR